jgi:hypothetical protein
MSKDDCCHFVSCLSEGECAGDGYFYIFLTGRIFYTLIIVADLGSKCQKLVEKSVVAGGSL